MSPPDALREALGQVIADQRREWRREREVIEAQSRQVIAELRAQIVELHAALTAKVDARLAEVRDGAPGVRGDVGPAGERGLQGERGPVGEQGPQGASGAVGERGEVGPIGEQGPQGASGAVGERGEVGPIGPKGDTGERGETGPVGDTGPAGAPGPQGERGEIGERGEPGAIGAPGPVGPAGERGIQGERGATGDVGPAGPMGERGEIGPAGERGEAGAAGVMGERGERGESGPMGERGLDGAPGKLPAVAEWQDRVYRDADVVTFNGAVYQAQRDTGKAPPHADWRCIVLAGRDGTDGRSLNLRSTWSADETYAQNDVVSLDGGSFAARRDNPGLCPGDGWKLIAPRGKPGRPGDKGERGEKGSKGDPGPAVVDFNIDSTGMAILTNSDGTAIERDLAPVLSQIGR